MKVTLGVNIEALRASNRLNDTSAKLGSTFSRLSSGLRVQSAADVALLGNLNLDRKIATVALRNANDGISVTNLAIDGIEQVIQILRRMEELANQSATGTFTNTQRSALSLEFNLLVEEADRTSKTTKFAGIDLLSNSSDRYVQVGFTGSASTSSILIPRTSATLSSVGIKNSNEQLTISIIGSTTFESQSLSRAAMPVIDDAIKSLRQRQATLAAAENRLHSAVNYLAAARENAAAAASQIADIDTATEVAGMVKLQILQSAQQAVLAQANQQPATVLKLIEGATRG